MLRNLLLVSALTASVTLAVRIESLEAQLSGLRNKVEFLERGFLADKDGVVAFGEGQQALLKAYRHMIQAEMADEARISLLEKELGHQGAALNKPKTRSL